MKRYHVSNNSGQSICLIGRRRIDFPKGSNVIVDLPDETVARLKRRYPLLRFLRLSSQLLPKKQLRLRISPLIKA